MADVKPATRTWFTVKGAYLRHVLIGEVKGVGGIKRCDEGVHEIAGTMDTPYYEVPVRACPRCRAIVREEQKIALRTAISAKP